VFFPFSVVRVVRGTAGTPGCASGQIRWIAVPESTAGFALCRQRVAIHTLPAVTTGTPASNTRHKAFKVESALGTGQPESTGRTRRHSHDSLWDGVIMAAFYRAGRLEFSYQDQAGRDCMIETEGRVSLGPWRVGFWLLESGETSSGSCIA
jgi:hypothetical protein